MKQGYSVEEFAGEILVSVQTIYNWLKEYPEFLEAKSIGEAASMRFWGGEGRSGLWGGKQFNPGVWVHNMKCRFGKFGWNPKSGNDEGDGREGFET